MLIQGKRLCMITVEIYSERAVQVHRVVLGIWPFVADAGEETLHIHCSGFPGHRYLHVSRVLHGILSWNGCSLLTLRKRLHIHFSGLLWYRALWHSRVKLGRHLEIAGHQMVTLGGRATQLLLRSPRTELFESEEFYSEDGLAVTVHWWWHWEDCTLIF